MSVQPTRQERPRQQRQEMAMFRAAGLWSEQIDLYGPDGRLVARGGVNGDPPGYAAARALNRRRRGQG